MQAPIEIEIPLNTSNWEAFAYQQVVVLHFSELRAYMFKVITVRCKSKLHKSHPDTT